MANPPKGRPCPRVTSPQRNRMKLLTGVLPKLLQSGSRSLLAKRAEVAASWGTGPYEDVRMSEYRVASMIRGSYEDSWYCLDDIGDTPESGVHHGV